jgi:hypothetical protein
MLFISTENKCCFTLLDAKELVNICMHIGLHPYEWTDRVRRVWRDRSLFC